MFALTFKHSLKLEEKRQKRSLHQRRKNALLAQNNGELLWKLKFLINYNYLILFMIMFTMISGFLLQVARGFGKNIHFTVSSILIGLSNILFNILDFLALNNLQILIITLYYIYL
mgnify:CR=1 FL=1